MEYFWTHQDNIPEGLGMGQFSLSHMFLLFSSSLLIIYIIRRYKRSDSPARLALRKYIAVSLLLLEAAKMIVMIVTGANVSTNLPLEICSFAEYAIVLDAFLNKSKLISKMLLYLFLPAAIMALVFPTTAILPMFNFFTIHQFLFHALIVAYSLMRFVAKETKTDYRSVWESIGAISLIALFVYIIDIVFNRNFMFLTGTYNNFMLNIIWNTMGGGILYDLGLVLFSILVIHIFYFLFSFIQQVFINRVSK